MSDAGSGDELRALWASLCRPGRSSSASAGFLIACDRYMQLIFDAEKGFLDQQAGQATSHTLPLSAVRLHGRSDVIGDRMLQLILAHTLSRLALSYGGCSR